VFGPEHPETLSSGSNIGAALALEGKYAEAEVQYREILKLKEKVLGSEHPSTLNTRFNIADVLVSQGNYLEAEAQAREVLKLHERVLGAEHPNTLIPAIPLPNRRGPAQVQRSGSGIPWLA
jgi:tetratricopeptide (TPR) repeat protein